MTAPQPEDERRSFTSRTPVNNNPDQVAYRRGFVTRHQVTGWRFVMRRIASGVALHDTRMLVDPLRTQSRAVLMGVILLVTGLAGCFVLSLIRPNGSVGNDTVLADRSTSALYVRIGDQLHPVLNLTSARLIAGRPSNPTMVKSSALDRFPRGNLVGIPGAPERMVQNTSRDADWTVCDAVSGPATGVTVIAGPLDSEGARAGDLGSGRAVLVRNNDSSWLLWDGRRSRIDLHDRAVTSALGLEANELTPRPIADGLFNAIPEAPALSAPDIPDAGNPPQFGMPVSAPVGAVVVAHAIDGASDNTRQYYAVLPDGLQPITPVLAAVLRNTQLLRPGRAAVAGRRPDRPAAGVGGAGHRPLPGAVDHPGRRRPRSGQLRALEPARWRQHQLADAAVRLGAAGVRRGAHPWTWSPPGPAAPPPGSRWRPAPATSPKPWGKGRPRHRTARCSGSATPGCATASTTRPPVPVTAKPLRRWA
ncbi:ESX-3 secretion system ATPase EccB3 [Mycobacterium talmoniae]|uniref:ESX-3 secretion system ATPase EccB3 n=1 Tax=Mycobacterium talmoniae TaxID=1858794 RepID=A0A2S8BFS5_9MYCO|nr:ESX-3 secretion system ATPase EccB3 [Mycobacterium talmoniae]